MSLGAKCARQLRILTALTFFAVAVFPAWAQETDRAGGQSISGAAISSQALQQINDILSEKAHFTAAQKKLGTRLAFSSKVARHEMGRMSFSDAMAPVLTDIRGHVVVDISTKGGVSDSLMNQIGAVGGQVINHWDRWNRVRASLPLSALSDVAAHSSVIGIRLPARAHTNIGSVTSQGVVSHAANAAQVAGFSGAGVKVGVLSDSATPAVVAALIASGDLPANTVVLPGEDGSDISGVENEGAAMMEIIHDLAPGAQLYFATAFHSDPDFADNIIKLQQAGCRVIVDDVSYFQEGAFEDTVIAQAVNQVTAAGVVYFSSAGNSGDLTHGTSGTYEGDFLSGGAVDGAVAASGETGFLHNFGTPASPITFDRLISPSAFEAGYILQWSDPFGASSNDYDFFLLNAAGTAVKGFSANPQTGTEDPVEEIFVPGGAAANDRLVVVLVSGSPRALHIDTERGQLAIATSGATIGHNAGLNTVSIAATYWNSAHTGTRPFTGTANPTEVFSSDGPRKIFFNPDGSAITPGNFLFGTNGGTTLQKPDLTAADGVNTRTPGFAPFFGTSASAPHAAALAALVLQARPAYTPAQVKAALVNTALNNMTPGFDRDGGFGIPMALPAINYATSH